MQQATPMRQAELMRQAAPMRQEPNLIEDGTMSGMVRCLDWRIASAG
jgi:hypothetical protein